MFRRKNKNVSSLLVDVLYERIKCELSRGNGFVDFKYRMEPDEKVWMEVVSCEDNEVLDHCYVDDNAMMTLKLAKWNTAKVANADGYGRYAMFEDSTDNSDFIAEYKPLFEQTLMTYKAAVASHNNVDLGDIKIDIDVVNKNKRLTGA
jgi:hypothetical protein